MIASPNHPQVPSIPTGKPNLRLVGGHSDDLLLQHLSETSRALMNALTLVESRIERSGICAPMPHVRPHLRLVQTTGEEVSEPVTSPEPGSYQQALKAIGFHFTILTGEILIAERRGLNWRSVVHDRVAQAVDRASAVLGH